jgi:hypothetical protein
MLEASGWVDAPWKRRRWTSAPFPVSAARTSEDLGRSEDPSSVTPALLQIQVVPVRNTIRTSTCLSRAIDSSRLIESGLSSLTQLDISPVPCQWGVAAPFFLGFDLAHRLLGGCPRLRPQDSEDSSRCLTV